MHMVLCYFVIRVMISTSLLVFGISAGLWLVIAVSTFGVCFNGMGFGVVIHSWLTCPPRTGTATHVVPRKMYKSSFPFRS